MEKVIILEQDMYDETGELVLKGGEAYLITFETEDVYCVFSHKIKKNGNTKYKVRYNWCLY